MQRLLLILGAACSGYYGKDPKLWPKPASATFSKNLCSLSSAFKFVNRPSRDNTKFDEVLNRAVTRANDEVHSLFTFGVPVRATCEISECTVESVDASSGWLPTLESESYQISLVDGVCLISCLSARGCMHGLTTFVQLIDPLMGFAIPASISIDDAPAFAHRGLMIDTGRRFLPVWLIMQNLRVMHCAKINVLHWHIVDDHSFPLVSEAYPFLSSKGAYSDRMVYTRADIQKIVAYANDLGIRVIPELDVPGHTQSWMLGYPELLGIAKSAIDPSREENYVFLANLLKEVEVSFRSPFFAGDSPVHLGGDETWDGWDTPDLRKWMAAHGLNNKGDLAKLWISRLEEIAQKNAVEIVLWEDFLQDMEVSVCSATGVCDRSITWQMWKQDWDETLAWARKHSSERVVWSSKFYLDDLNREWNDFYGLKIVDNVPNLLGGEACMWGESVDEFNFMSRVWPRAAAVAERLWTNPDSPATAATSRLAKWICRSRHFFKTPIGNAGKVPSDDPDVEWIWHTEREQWHCEEEDVLNEGARLRLNREATDETVVLVQ